MFRIGRSRILRLRAQPGGGLAGGGAKARLKQARASKGRSGRQLIQSPKGITPQQLAGKLVPKLDPGDSRAESRGGQAERIRRREGAQLLRDGNLAARHPQPTLRLARTREVVERARNRSARAAEISIPGRGRTTGGILRHQDKPAGAAVIGGQLRRSGRRVGETDAFTGADIVDDRDAVGRRRPQCRGAFDEGIVRIVEAIEVIAGHFGGIIPVPTDSQGMIARALLFVDVVHADARRRGGRQAVADLHGQSQTRLADASKMIDRRHVVGRLETVVELAAAQCEAGLIDRVVVVGHEERVGGGRNRTGQRFIGGDRIAIHLDGKTARHRIQQRLS